MKRIILLLLAVGSLTAGDVMVVDPAGTVIVTGTAPATASSGEVRIGAGQVNAQGKVTAGDVVVNRTTQADGAQAVRGDDPRMINSRPANGGNADTVDGKHAADFIGVGEKGVANGVANLDASGKVPGSLLPASTSRTLWTSWSGGGAFNSTAEGSILGAPGSGSYGSNTIAANTLQPGHVIRIKINGYIRTLNSSQVLTMRVKFGGFNVISIATTIPNTYSDVGFSVEQDLICRVNGASAVISANGGRMLIDNTTNFGPPNMIRLATAHGVASPNTTIDNSVDVTGQWSVASSSNVIVGLESTIELLKP